MAYKFKLSRVSIQPATGGFIVSAQYRKASENCRRYKDATFVAVTAEAALNIAARLMSGTMPSEAE